MRITSNNLAIEELPTPKKAFLSLEEELEVADRANTDANEVRAAIAQADRTLEVSDSMSDLADTVGRITEATPTEIELIDRVAEATVAGTDVDPERVAPAMESYLGKRIATEGFTEQSKKAFEAVMEFVKKIREKIISFYNQDVALPAQMKRVDDLIAAIKASEKKEVTLRAGSAGGLNALMINGKLDVSYRVLDAGLAGLQQDLMYVMTDHNSTVAMNGHAVSEAMRLFNPASPEASLANLARSLSQPPNALPKGSAPSVDEDGTRNQRGPDRLGSYHLVMRIPSVEESNVIGSLERFRKPLVTLEAGEPGADSEAPATNYGQTEMIALLERCRSILKQLLAYRNSSEYKELLGVSNLIEKSSKDLGAKVQVEPGSEEEKALRALLSFNMAYASWMENPSMPLYQKSLNAVRATVALLSKGIEGSAEQ